MGELGQGRSGNRAHRALLLAQLWWCLVGDRVHDANTQVFGEELIVVLLSILELELVVMHFLFGALYEGIPLLHHLCHRVELRKVLLARFSMIETLLYHTSRLACAYSHT